MLETDLTIDQIGFPTFSARNCHQTLTPITTGDFRRSLSGKLLYTGHVGHQKYRSIIQGEDKMSPALERVWRGSIVQVGCLVALSQEIQLPQEIELKRESVQNSVIALTENQEKIKIEQFQGRKIRLENHSNRQDKVFVFYRPLLIMRVLNYQFSTDEWGFKNRWQLDLEEM